MIYRMMPTSSSTIVVTGGAGYIGRRVVERLARRFSVASIDKERPKSLPAGVEFFQADLTSDASVRTAFEAIGDRYGNRLASCVHLAAHADFSGEPSPLYQQLTVDGTRRVLQALKGYHVEQFLFSSTVLLMKPAEDETEIITESSPVDPAWDYPRSKVEAASVIRQLQGEIPAVVLRIAGVYDDQCHSIPLAQQIVRIYEKKLDSYLFPGDPDHAQPYIHLDDLIDCIEHTIDHRLVLDKHEVFLIAERDLVSYAEAQEQLGQLIHGKEWPAIRIPKVVAKAGAWIEDKLAGEKETFIKPWMVDLADDHYPIAIDRANQRLEWAPNHQLRDTFSPMIGYLKKNPAAWYKENGIPAPKHWPEEELREGAA